MGRPRDDQDVGGRRQGAGDTGQREKRNPNHEDPTAPIPVSRSTTDQQNRREEQQIPVRDPLQVGDRGAEVGLDGRQRHIDDGRIDERQARPKDRRREDEATRPSESEPDRFLSFL